MIDYTQLQSKEDETLNVPYKIKMKDKALNQIYSFND